MSLGKEERKGKDIGGKDRGFMGEKHHKGHGGGISAGISPGKKMGHEKGRHMSGKMK